MSTAALETEASSFSHCHLPDYQKTPRAYRHLKRYALIFIIHSANAGDAARPFSANVQNDAVSMPHTAQLPLNWKD